MIPVGLSTEFPRQSPGHPKNSRNPMTFLGNSDGLLRNFLGLSAVLSYHYYRRSTYNHYILTTYYLLQIWFVAATCVVITVGLRRGGPVHGGALRCAAGAAKAPPRVAWQIRTTWIRPLMYF